VVFGRDLVGILVAWWQGLRRREPFATAESRLAWWIILGTIPGVLAGLLLEDTFEALFSQPRAAGGFLLLTAALLTMAEVLSRRQRELAETKWWDALLIGIGQAAAIAPGLSRSGTTITVGMFRHLTREAAARFSFLLAVPIVAGAGLAQLARWILSDGTTAQALPLLIGLLAAALSGYLAIRFLLAYLRRRPLYPFAVYCAIIGVLAIVFL
jgi:undecaprenyl-diphosphatase